MTCLIAWCLFGLCMVVVFLAMRALHPDESAWETVKRMFTQGDDGTDLRLF